MPVSVGIVREADGSDLSYASFKTQPQEN